MIESLPTYVVVTFITTTLITVGLFLLAIKRSRDDKRVPVAIYLILGLWMLIQAILGWNGFYRNFNAVPPRFLLTLLPPLAVIVYFLIAQKQAILQLPIRLLTFIHVIRIPVEIILFWLYQNGHIPQLMTYEGRNFDILAGITAPMISQVAFRGGYVHKGLLIFWNILTLGLLLNIVTNAILSAPFPFQLFANEQPNIAVFFFPFTWLPSVIVQIVLFCHLASLYKLTRQ
ncbi:MAG: hypothetical protein QGG64_22420 [Candidatus Latescibacteria bacterium]|jgi:hypothetical protein|nr:hypothetical protein [Candidatus Latescibacterota bacterium]